MVNVPQDRRLRQHYAPTQLATSRRPPVYSFSLPRLAQSSGWGNRRLYEATCRTLRTNTVHTTTMRMEDINRWDAGRSLNSTTQVGCPPEALAGSEIVAGLGTTTAQLERATGGSLFGFRSAPSRSLNQG